MGTDRKFNKKPATRPVKAACAKKRRVKVQHARLVKLGVDETVVKKLNTKQVRQMLRKPDKIGKGKKCCCCCS